jgi:TorA maturation chaperone TorD
MGMPTQTIELRKEQAATYHLARSAAYRLLSQATAYPTDEVVAALGDEDLSQAQAAAEVLGETFSERLDAFEREAKAASADELRSQHGRIFSHILSLDCPPCETVYTAREIFEETDQLSDIAGFFRAFGLDLAERERPDHITVELEFMQLLTAKEAYAQLHHGPEKARLCRVVQRKFMEDHLGRWGQQFAQQLERQAPAGYFRALAGLIDAFLEAEVSYLRTKPEVLRVNADWRSKIDEEGCSTTDECPNVESGGQNGNLIQL